MRIEKASTKAIKYITKGKIKYLYPLSKDTRKICESIKKPYSEI